VIVTHTSRLLLALLMLIPSTALSYSINLTPGGYVVRWSKADIGYYTNPKGSDDISNGSDVSAITAAFNDWQNIGCSKLTFQKQGDTNTNKLISNGAEPNGKNELAWVEDNSWSFGKYTLAVTSPIIYSNGSMVEADIAFNGYLNKWSTVGQFGRADVKSVALHEIGHMFGLQHNLAGFNQNNPPTMAPVVDPYGKTASLETDDTYGPCFLYPAGQKFDCNNADMCPYVVEKNPDNGQEYYAQKLACEGGVCKFGGGDPPAGKALGEQCATQTECGTPLFCQPIQGGGGFCSQFCEPTLDDCPSGFGCFAYSNADGGACLPTGDAKKGLGEDCTGQDQCETNLCYPSMTGGWQCRNPCQDDPDCPAGEECFFAPGYPTAACMPEALVPSYKVQDGDPCNEDADCESEVCVLNPGSGGPRFCRSACDPAAPACSVGFICAELGPKGGACVPAPETPTLAEEGEPCVSGSECLTDMCFGGICRRSCNVVSSTCDEGTEGCQRVTPDGLVGTCEARGAVALGLPCNGDADCWSRFCEQPVDVGGRRCLEPCPAGGEDCLDAQQCAAVPSLTLLGACVDADGTPDDPDVTTTGEEIPPPTPPGDRTTSRSTGCASTPAPMGSPLAAMLLLLAGLIVTRRHA